MTARLTEEQIAQSDLADSQGQTFAAVSPDILFGKNANGALAEQVYRVNIRRYRALRDEWEMSQGYAPREKGFWHRLPVKGDH